MSSLIANAFKIVLQICIEKSFLYSFKILINFIILVQNILVLLHAQYYPSPLHFGAFRFYFPKNRICIAGINDKIVATLLFRMHK